MNLKKFPSSFFLYLTFISLSYHKKNILASGPISRRKSLSHPRKKYEKKVSQYGDIAAEVRTRVKS